MLFVIKFKGGPHMLTVLFVKLGQLELVAQCALRFCGVYCKQSNHFGQLELHSICAYSDSVKMQEHLQRHLPAVTVTFERLTVCQQCIICMAEREKQQTVYLAALYTKRQRNNTIFSLSYCTLRAIITF